MFERHSMRACFACLVFLSGLGMLLGVGGCEKKSGDAVVVGKEYIPALILPETPGPTEKNPAESMASSRQVEPGAMSHEGDYLQLDENVVLPNPRATHNEQWIVDVEMVAGGRKIAVRVDQPRFEKLSIGDRVKVVYRVGKYTNTVWDSKIK
jgi:hypothetical protein